VEPTWPQKNRLEGGAAAPQDIAHLLRIEAHRESVWVQSIVRCVHWVRTAIWRIASNTCSQPVRAGHGLCDASGAQPHSELACAAERTRSISTGARVGQGEPDDRPGVGDQSRRAARPRLEGPDTQAIRPMGCPRSGSTARRTRPRARRGIHPGGAGHGGDHPPQRADQAPVRGSADPRRHRAHVDAGARTERLAGGRTGAWRS
jgi:hypothetical protein